VSAIEALAWRLFPALGLGCYGPTFFRSPELLKRALHGALSLVAAAFMADPGHADSPPAALVIDANTGDVLQAVEPNHRWYPASLTKMMTVYLAFREIEANRLTLGETLIASQHAAAQTGTRLGLTAGDTMTTEQAA